MLVEKIIVYIFINIKRLLTISLDLVYISLDCKSSLISRRTPGDDLLFKSLVTLSFPERGD